MQEILKSFRDIHLTNQSTGSLVLSLLICTGIFSLNFWTLSPTDLNSAILQNMVKHMNFIFFFYVTQD